MAPRELARLRADRALSLNAYALLHLVAELGADRDRGIAVTNEYLAALLGVSDKTVSRSLQTLRVLRLLDYDDHERVAGFTLRTGEALRTLLRTPSADTGTPSTVRSAADTPVPAASPDPAPQAASAGVESADTRARAQTDTDTDKDHRLTSVVRCTSADVVPLNPKAGAQELVAHFVDVHRAATDEPAPRRLVGQIAKQVGELLRDGVSAPTIARALGLLVEKRLNPATLPSLVAEAAAGPRRDREHIADRLYRSALEARRREDGTQ